MKSKIVAVTLLALMLPATAQAEEEEKIKDIFKSLYKTFGKDCSTEVKIVSEPEEVEMRNGRVKGKRWFATCGKYRFKITIQDETEFKLDRVVEMLEKIPFPYIRACEAVSDETEDGIAIYAYLGGAGAHGGKSYINMVPRGNALMIAHEMGHTLEQVAREADPEILNTWEEAIKTDKISVSSYGDKVRHEDLAEFAQVYAVCLGAGEESLAKLKKLSPTRYELWEEMLEDPDVDDSK